MSTHSFSKLYVKEIKSIYKFFLVLLVIQIVYVFFLLDINFFHAYMPISETYIRNSNFVVFANLPMFLSLLIFPCLFLFSWFSEENSKTHYQLLSLPGRVHMLMKSKMLAILTLGMIWVIGLVIFINLMEIFHSSNRTTYVETSLFYRIHGFFYTYLRFFGYLIILMGITSIVTGLLQKIKQFRLLAGTIVFILFSYAIFLNIILIFGHFYTVILGLVCMYVGFYLFEKYSEVL